MRCIAAYESNEEKREGLRELGMVTGRRGTVEDKVCVRARRQMFAVGVSNTSSRYIAEKVGVLSASSSNCSNTQSNMI
jgi:hypothetical protein